MNVLCKQTVDIRNAKLKQKCKLTASINCQNFMNVLCKQTVDIRNVKLKQNKKNLRYGTSHVFGKSVHTYIVALGKLLVSFY